MTYFAKAVSYILHPIIVPILTLLVLFTLPTLPYSFYLFDSIYFFPHKAKLIMLFIVGVFTCIAPGLSLLIMKWNGMISSLQLENRKERLYPYAIVTFYFLLTFVYFRYEWPEELRHPAFLSFIFGMMLSFLVAFLLNFKWKVSIHTLGWFGMLGGLAPYLQSQQVESIEVLPAIAVAGGLVGASRIYIKAHELSEVLLGMAIGLFVMYICVKYSIYV